MGKHDVIHASDLNDEQLTFENLRYLYGTGRSYIISGSGKYRKMGYRMGVQTELGDLEESEWQQLMRALIKKAGEQELHLQLLQWVTNHCAWLHSRLTLASDHRANLVSRGLSEEKIITLGYKTTPIVGMKTLAKQLLAEGFYLSGVPGFYRKDGQWTFIHESRGILIPVRDLDGRIQGLQIRRDNATRRKFRWISSIGKDDGCKAEAWIHIAGKPCEKIILTEGPMKADIVHELTSQTVLAVAGVSALSQLDGVLVQLREKGVRKIMTAFDMDFLTNPHVENGYKNLKRHLTDNGFQYGTYLWDPQYKGLDDYVWQYCLHRQIP